MEIRQLRAFVAIAESGTFTAGALRVFVFLVVFCLLLWFFDNYGPSWRSLNRERSLRERYECT